MTDPAKCVEAMPDNERDPYSDFQQELAGLINSHSIENRTNTPDFILAELMVENLKSLEHYNRARNAWGDAHFSTLKPLDE